jgi:hypothetical protein
MEGRKLMREKGKVKEEKFKGVQWFRGKENEFRKRNLGKEELREGILRKKY